MRLDDRTLTIFTGAFLTVAVSTMAEYGDPLMASFRGEREVHAVDDIYTIRPGQDQQLRVLLNDVGVRGLKPEDVQLTARPACGRVERRGYDFIYFDNAGCRQTTSFTYCLRVGTICEPARVMLRAPLQFNPRPEGPPVSRRQPSDEPQPTRRAEAAPAPDRAAPARLAAPTGAAGRGADFVRPDPLVRVSLASPVGDAPRQPQAPLAGGDEAAATEKLPNPALDTPLEPAPANSEASPTGPVEPVIHATSPQGQGCAPDLKVAALPGGLIELSLKAQCHPRSVATIDHAGLRFTMRTSALGGMHAVVPAFESPARIRVTFGDGAQAEALLAAPGLEALDRYALSWQGVASLWLKPAEGTPAAPMRLGDGAGRGARLALVQTVPHRSGARGKALAEMRLVADPGPGCGSRLKVDRAVSLAGRAQTLEPLVIETPRCNQSVPVAKANVFALPALAEGAAAGAAQK